MSKQTNETPLMTVCKSTGQTVSARISEALPRRSSLATCQKNWMQGALVHLLLEDWQNEQHSLKRSILYKNVKSSVLTN